MLTLLTLGCRAEAAARPTPAAQWDSPAAAVLVAAPGVLGDPATGRRLFVAASTAGCHTVQCVSAATGVTGPNLTNVVLCPTLAGEVIPMSPETLAAFLQDPTSVKPGTAMPNVGLTPDEARHLTAFHYSQPYSPSR